MRSVCIGDTHLTVADMESQSLFPRQLVALPEKEATALYECMREAIESAKDVVLAWILDNGPWDSIIHLGDITGGWKEQGCAHFLPRTLMRSFYSKLRAICPRVRYCIGNHDTGSTHAGSLPGGGINEASVSACEEVLGDLWWEEEWDGIVHIGIASPLLEYSGDDPAIQRRKRDQKTFVGDTLSRLKKPWVFYLHRATACKFLAQEIGDHVNTMCKMICGDAHDPRVMRFVRGCAGVPFLPFVVGKETSFMLRCLQKCVLCPSTAPLWWRGHGLLALLSLREDIAIKEIVLPSDPSFANLPFTSKMRCALWMIRPRAV